MFITTTHDVGFIKESYGGSWTGRRVRWLWIEGRTCRINCTAHGGVGIGRNVNIVVDGWEVEFVEEGEGGEIKSGELFLMKRTWLNRDERRPLSFSESVSVSLVSVVLVWTAQWAV